GKLAKIYENQRFAAFAKTGDIYCLFYEKGFNLLNTKGLLCFITSNKWMRAGYVEKLLYFFAKNVNPILLVDFAGVKVFDSATVDTNILLFEKSKNAGKTRSCIATSLTKDGLSNLSDFVQHNSTACEFATSDSWVILSPIEQSIKRKIETVGVPLKDWDISINYGIKTGFNDAFIVSGAKRDEILANCKTDEEREKTAELIRPILRGRDIKRYSYEYADLYLIATFPAKHYDIEKYPAVKDYLLSFGMERLEQTGKEHTIKGEKIKARKKTNNKWFETQDSISYWDEFNKPKIVWGNLNLSATYTLAPAGMMINAPATMIVPASESLLCILNSKLADYYIRNLGVTRNGGYFEYKPMFIEQLPVPQNIDEKLFEEFSKKELNNEEEIDRKVYELYGLTKDEIAFIEDLN
ncbi:MAG: Eco57I restriction-modification methylase domain-containing protein, partial [Treponema sp.]|nr:Eco57I restriction-modification methylase domain-containing protein [Treponema sp.]